MSHTPIIDAALRKAIAPGGNIEEVCIRFLRAALPLDPKWPRSSAVTRLTDLMRELYPERFDGAPLRERKITVTSTGYDPAIGRAVRDPTLK